MLTELLEKYKKLIYQFSRFAGIGFLNTAVDFSALNLLIALTGITAGLSLAFINAISFTAAVVHSYFWNKFWAFGSAEERLWRFLTRVFVAGCLGIIIILMAVWGAGREYSFLYFAILIVVLFIGEIVMWKSFHLSSGVLEQSEKKEFVMFLVVSLIGVVINSSIVGAVTKFVSPQFGLNPHLWANLAKAVATAVALIWNFTGYKLMVFRK